ncbi:hypothetical protein Hdeb2414_s0004g00128081 [Helianthus debilis subsp. tardiflorus]
MFYEGYRFEKKKREYTRHIVSSRDVILATVLASVGREIQQENVKGFLPVTDKKDGYSFLYPFGWQEVAVEGRDKVFKDVIEPLENVSVNAFPTNKEDIRDLGSPQEVLLI